MFVIFDLEVIKFLVKNEEKIKRDFNKWKKIIFNLNFTTSIAML